jgi:chemotaxis protein MotB
MARRRRQEPEHENHERWLVSYADFITLLFAFFVVMYAISSVNEGKYRVLSDTLNAIFSDPYNADPGLPAAAATPAINAPIPPPVLVPEPMPTTPLVGSATEEPLSDDRFQDLRRQLEISLQDYQRDDQIEVTGDAHRIEVRIKSALLFGSGSASLARPALQPLREVARILAPLTHSIQVEGHTDDVPISTQQYPSNWELSAARAASVVHFLSRLGVSPDRLSAVGYGEHRPVASNANEGGRARNRRVTLAVLAPQAIPWAEGPALPEPAARRPAPAVPLEALQRTPSGAGGSG